MASLQNLWITLTAPRISDEDAAQREHATRMTLVVMGGVWIVYTLVIALGWRGGLFPPENVKTNLLMGLPVGIAWWLTHRGYWRLGSYVPPAVLFVLGVCGSYAVGLVSPSVLFYVMAILLTALLHPGRAQWLVLVASICAHLAIGWSQSLQGSNPLGTGFLVTGSFVVVALVHWLSTRQLARAQEEKQAGSAGRQQAESRRDAALQASEARYRLLAENASDVIWTADMDLRLSYLSPSVTRVRGYSVEEAMAQRPHEIYTPASLALVKQTLQEELALERSGNGEPGRSHVLELELYRKDGTTFWSETRLSLLRDPEGKPLGILGVGRDITERKRAEKALRRSLGRADRSQRLLLALSQAAQAVQRARMPGEVFQTIGDEIARLGYQTTIFTVTEDRSHLAASHLAMDSGILRAAEKLTGLSAQSYRFPLVPGSFYQRLVAEGKAVFSNPGAEPIVEALPERVRPLAGRLASALGLGQAIYAPLTIGGETHSLLSVIGTDLTEDDVPAVTVFANQAAIALENAYLYGQAQRDAETKATLLREVNHRVKNNLALIIGLIHAEQEHAELAGQSAYQSTLEDLSGRVMGLSATHDLLSASAWMPVPLSKLACQVIESVLQALCLDKNVSFNVSPSPVRVTPEVAQNMALVVNELITNSVKYALPDQATLHISVRILLEEDPAQKGDWVLFELRDNGPGYPEEVLRRERYGVGFDLIQSIVCDGLRGELALRNERGALTSIRFKHEKEEKTG